MSEKIYNLLDEKWILATDDNGNIQEYSIPEIFEHAHELKALAGDIPQQDVVMLRFLLAIMYAVYLRNDENGNPSKTDDPKEMYGRWKALRDKQKFDIKTIKKYLESYRNRFYLFHPTRPFYQAPITKGTDYEASKLNGTLSESSNKPRLFKPTTVKKSLSMEFDKAARWLMYLHAYDDTSSKPTIRGANMPSCGAGWLGKIGPIYADGRNLFETLMLNLVLVDSEECVFPDGVATWEPEECHTDERTPIPTPTSPLEILTLQSRRVLLQRKQDKVTGYKLMGGDIVAKENAIIEQMTMWRKTDSGDLVPKRLDPSRFLWRDYPSLLAITDNETEGRKPGIISWLSALEYRGIINDSTVSFHCTGISYGDKDFFVDDLIDDNIRFNAKLLNKFNDSWNNRIAEAIKRTDDCVKIYGSFVADVAIVSGMDEEAGPKVFQNARGLAFASLDQPFRQWLSSITPSGDEESQFNSWNSVLEKKILSMGQEVAESAGPMAMKGKPADPSKPNDPPQNVFAKYKMFRGKIMKKTRRNEDDQS